MSKSVTSDKITQLPLLSIKLAITEGRLWTIYLQNTQHSFCYTHSCINFLAESGAMHWFAHSGPVLIFKITSVIIRLLLKRTIIYFSLRTFPPPPSGIIKRCYNLVISPLKWKCVFDVLVCTFIFYFFIDLQVS